MSSSGTSDVGERDLPRGHGPPYSETRRRLRRWILARDGTLAGRSVLVTGAGGFIGGHLVERLVRDGAPRARVVPLQLARRPRHARLARPARCVAEVEVVARRPARRRVGRRGRRAARRSCFHLGALIAIPYSYVNPRDFVEINVLGTLNVAQAALRARRAAGRPHLDQRGLRHGADRPDHRGAPARAAVAVRREQDRRRQADATASTAPSSCR